MGNILFLLAFIGLPVLAYVWVRSLTWLAIWILASAAIVGAFIDFTIDAGRLWFCLHNRDLEEAIKALVSLRELVGEFVTGQRKLPVRATTAPQLKSRRPLAPAGVIAPPKDAKKKKPKPPRVFSGNTRKPGSHRGPY